MYHIFGCYSIIVDTLILAYKDGNDVITLLLGSSDGWTEGSSSIVASRIADRSRVVTIAAGNSGKAGGWFKFSPGNGLSVISIS